MNIREKKLKDLLAKLTLEYIDKYKGKNNADQINALSDIKLITKSFEAISMSRFIEDQKKYIQLIEAKNSIDNVYQKLRAEDKIPACIPRAIDNHAEHFMHEDYAYLLFEILQGKHNEFLKRIINPPE